MATALYLTSLEPAGKTALGLAIGKDIVKRGKKAGYFIPVTLLKNGGISPEDNAMFVRGTMGLQESVDVIAPMHFTPMQLWNSLSTDTADFDYKLKTVYKDISSDKDMVIVEGLSGLISDATATLLCYRVSEILNARVVVILRYSDNLRPDILSRVKMELKDKLVGVVVNYVPENRIDFVKDNLPALFDNAGLKLLGLIPEKRTLLGITVAELARDINGEILSAKDNLDTLVENVMLGAMTPDSGISYFGRKQHKAVIVNVERSDMQLAAMETSTACIILTGNKKPLEQVIHQSEIKKIPLIAVNSDIPMVINKLEDRMASNAFNNAEKLKLFQQITANSVDYGSLYKATGIFN